MKKILDYRFIILLSFIFLTAIIYSNTLNAPFIFDDLPNIVNNIAIKDINYFKNLDMVFDFSFNESIRPFFLNRYIGYLTFALNYKQTGLDTVSYHVTNIIIHLINVILVFLLLKITLSDTSYGKGLSLSEKEVNYIAVLVSSLFAFHPIQTQAVTYIVQRFASLASLFYLLSLVLYTYWRVRYSDLKYPLFYILALISVICAMKTKEITFILPIMILLYDLVFIRDTYKNRVVYLAPFMLCMAIIPLTIISASGLQDGLNASNHFDISRWHYLYTQFTVIIKYISLLLLPINQTVDYAYPLCKSFLEPNVALSFLLLITIFIIAVYLVTSKKICPIWRLTGFGMLWFFITLSVESSIIPIADYIYEHRLYLPSVGFFMAIVSLFYKILYPVNSGFVNKGLMVLFICIILIVSCATYSRNTVWADEERLWKDNINKQPLKARGYTNLSNYYYKKQDTQKAVDVLEQGFGLIRDDLFLYNNLAIAYTANGNYDKVELLLDEMYRKFPDNKGWVYTRYGYLYKKQNQLDKSYDMFVKALLNKQYNHEIWSNISRILFKQGHYERALMFSKMALLNNCITLDCLNLTAQIAEKLNKSYEAQYYYKKMIKVAPTLLNDLIADGVNLMMSGNNEKARDSFLYATKIDNTSSEAFYFLAVSEFKLNDIDKAKANFYKAIELNTEYLHYAYFFLTKIYQRQGDKENAIKHIRKALEIKPDYELATKTLRDLEHGL